MISFDIQGECYNVTALWERRVHKGLNIKQNRGKNEKSRLGLTLIRPWTNENRIWMNMINFKRFILECQLYSLLLKGRVLKCQQKDHSICGKVRMK